MQIAYSKLLLQDSNFCDTASVDAKFARHEPNFHWILSQENSRVNSVHLKTSQNYASLSFICKFRKKLDLTWCMVSKKQICMH